MKVQVILEFDIPTDEYSNDDIKAGMLEQDACYATLQYMTCKHTEDVMRWIAQESKSENEQEKLGAKSIAKHHETWADILDSAVWKFKIL